MDVTTERTDDGMSALASYLTGASEGPPDPVLIRRAGLAGYVVARGEQPAQVPPTLRSDHRAALLRHLTIRRAVEGLLRAWTEAGVEVLVFKGFHLAEFVYPDPAMRLYSDVDLLIRPESAETARRSAVAAGLELLWHAGEKEGPSALRAAAYDGHELMQLRHPEVGLQLDVHRRLVHNNHNRSRRYRRQQRMTDLAWEASQAIELGGLPLRQLHPLDAVLLGLVLNRCWSPEDWRLRPHDYLDFRLLVEKHGLRLDDLYRRARELGCPRSFELFLHRCDPFSGRFELTGPSPLELQRFNIAVAGERGNRYLQRSLHGAADLARAPLEIGRALPTVLSSAAQVRSLGLREAAALTRERSLSGGSGELPSDTWLALRRGVHRAVRLLAPILAARPRDVEAAALLRVLRRAGCPAELRWERTGGAGEMPYLVLEGERLNVSGTLLATESDVSRPDSSP